MASAQAPLHAAGHGASVVCLHGLGRTPRDWDGVAAGLAAYGAVLTPQLPRDPSSALARADAVIRTGDIVVGHSIGGVLALRLALERPRPLAAVILTSCFFPPALNGRSRSRTAADYAAHRLAYVRSLRRIEGGAVEAAGTLRALASLLRLVRRRAAHDEALAATTPCVLVLHARDDHVVPIDFALGAARRRPEWDVRTLGRGGHYPQLADPAGWLDAVTPWLGRVSGGSG